MSGRNLLSKEWCNLIFEGRNKDYGAYQIRRNIGKRYLVAITVVFSIVLILVAISVAVHVMMANRVETMMEELRENFPKMKTAEAEMCHDMKLIAGGRRPSRMTTVKKGTTQVPEIVEVTKNDIQFGVDEFQEETVGDVVDAEIVESFEELDSIYDERLANLPVVEEPTLQPTEVVEEMPQFPGGITALMKWLDENVVYPPECVKMKIGGELQVNFLVDVDGKLMEPRIVYSLHPDLDRSVLNAIRRMPRWSPGKKDGRLTVVSVTLPVHFQPR